MSDLKPMRERAQRGGLATIIGLSLFIVTPLASCTDNDGGGGSGGAGPVAGQPATGGSPASNAGRAGAGASGGAARAGAGGMGAAGMAAAGMGAGGVSAGAAGARNGGAAGQLEAGASGASGAAQAGMGGGGAPPMSCIDNFDCEGFKCCGGECVNPANDPYNCGMCGVACTGGTPYCDGGQCAARPCTATCENGQTCCGGACCGAGDICCMSTIGPARPECRPPVNGTCPLGCAGCG
jgi:hypothetical protein